MRYRVAPIVLWLGILGGFLAVVSKPGNARQTANVTPGPQKTIEYVEWDQPEPPAWLETAIGNELDDVRTHLSTLVKIRCEAKPLFQALKLLEAQIDTKIFINTTELGLIGVDPDCLVNIEASGKLKDVLQMMLANVADADGNLTWRLLPMGIQITSKEAADAEPELRTFDLTYFLPDASHAERLVELVQMHIDPDSWVVAGGTNVVNHFGSQLVVSAPSSTNQRIETLLAHISKQKREHLKAPKYKEDKAEPAPKPALEEKSESK